MPEIPIKIQFVKTLSNIKPSRIIALKRDADTDFTLYVTDKTGGLFPLKDNNSGIITAIQNLDGNLDISGTTTKIINIAPELLITINSAIQSGDDISKLANDANYITEAPTNGNAYTRKDGEWVETTKFAWESTNW